jgi:CheY-like chemotaxis protein
MLFKQPPSYKTTVALISREELALSIDVQVKLQRASGTVIGFECHLSTAEQDAMAPQPGPALNEDQTLEYDEKHLADLQALYRPLQRQLARLSGPLDQKLTRLFRADIATLSARKQVSEIEHLTKKLASLNQQIACFTLRHIPEPRLIDVNQLIEKISRQLERLFPSSITIERELDKDVAAVRGDADLLVHAIGNLCKNAMEAMPNGGVLVIKSQRIENDQDQEFVLIVISDTGHGFTEEMRDALFEPFHSTKKSIGAGLGLAAVYGIIKGHGGSIGVKSEQAKGTTISMSLPALIKTGSDDKAYGGEDDVSAGRILIIDDELEIAEATAMALRRDGYTVFTCTSCEDAFKISDQISGDLDLFILDNQLVGTTGAACAKELISKNPKTPMLFYSGADDDPDLMSFIKRTGAGWLKKPFSTQDLLSLVNSLILQSQND